MQDGSNFPFLAYTVEDERMESCDRCNHGSPLKTPTCSLLKPMSMSLPYMQKELGRFD